MCITKIDTSPVGCEYDTNDQIGKYNTNQGNLYRDLELLGHVSSNKCMIAFEKFCTNILWSEPASVRLILQRCMKCSAVDY